MAMKKTTHPFLRDLKDNRVKWLMILPAAVVVILMCYIPMAGIVLAFKEFNYHDGIFGSPWAGFRNFEYFFRSGKAWITTRNTILYNIAFLCVNTLLQITCAILLSELAGKYFKRITQSVMFFPYFISWVVVGAFIYNMFNYEFGAVNTFLRNLGAQPLDVYSNKAVWPVILIAVSAFKNVGYGTVMYLASIVSIDGEMFEAADLDGATMWQKIRHITLPCIRPTVVILFLMAIGTIMKGDFQMFWQVTGNNPMVIEVTDVIDTYVTRSLLELQEFGMTSAAGLYQSGLSFVLVLLANYAVKKVEPEYALF
jgi:putative aldouronate transport system permease protein